MEVSRHQAIRWAKQSFACGRVEHHFAKRSVESNVEPALAAQVHGHAPEDDRVRFIELALETRQVVGEMGTLLWFGWIGRRRVGMHRKGLVQSWRFSDDEVAADVSRRNSLLGAN